MPDEMKALETVREEIKGVTKEFTQLLEKQDEEIKQNGATSKETAEKVAKMEEHIDQIKADEQGIAERLEKMELEAQKPRYSAGDAEVKMTPGMQFVTSDVYKNASQSRATTPFYEVGSMFELKTLVGDSGTTDSAVRPDRMPQLFYDPGQREMRLLDIMNVQPTNSNAIEYTQETTFDPDNAAAQDGEGSAKSEGDMAFEVKTSSVVTIAHWIPASRQVLDDAPMLQGYIDGRLTYSIMKKLEDELLFGDGTGGSMTGVHNTDGVDTIGAPEGSDTILDHIRKAFRDVRLSEYAPNAIILNPTDWATIELLKDDDSRYIWTSVPNGGQMQLWRVPVIESTVMEEGRFLTGAFNLGATVHDRQQAQIRISESHSDYFTKNIVAILAELRMALTVERPKAFVKGTLNDEIAT